MKTLMVIGGIVVALAVLAVLWREFDDWRDRRKQRAFARAAHLDMQEHAWKENEEYDISAALCSAQCERQKNHRGASLDRGSKRAA